MKLVRTLACLIGTLSLILDFTAALPACATPGIGGFEGRGFHYRYVSLDDATLGLDPSTSFFDPAAINNSGRVYGTLYTCTDVCLTEVAVYEHGTLTSLQPGVAYAANNGGTVGGSVLVDPDQFIEQAAIFHGNRVTVIPRRPEEYTSHVMRITDSGLALLSSTDVNGNTTLVLYRDGQGTPLHFGSSIPSPDFLSMNNHGIISGTNLAISSRGFRFNPWTDELTLLNPLSTEPESWAMDINNRGDVLGYSFVPGRLERIGVWDRKGNFEPYFVEGTKEVSTVSNSLLFNENNLIVISRTTDDNSYLVPTPGVRLNLADITEDLPPNSVMAPLQEVLGLNDCGDMIGGNVYGTSLFLLKRTHIERGAGEGCLE